MTIAAPVTAGAPVSSGNRLYWMFADLITVTKRNLIAYTRIPEALFFSTLQPIMFVLLFRYVFGAAIPIPGGVPYVDYMMPGIFVQSVMFGAVSTSVGLAEDLQKGLIERFRALPMARSAVLAGRTTADALRNVVVILVMTAVAFAVGFRIGPGVIDYVLGAIILLVFAYSMSWGFAAIGLSAPNSETAQVMSFPILFPLTFASTAFVPIQTLPGWLQGFARHQPVSVAIDAARSLMVGGYYHSTSEVWYALAWIAGMLVVFVPLGVWKYRKTA
ncbi:MAG TPA: ABC transporter permease [Acidimicrobiales bacterium]|jgi:ABC-2 type transport system permease protein/oleandomycin transport system permease protein|nr:ABC transporter permease [Acidimicrobiales bacterium]